ncbi:MAG: hypothetical protein J6B08_00120 [Ruminiclostridium sp.]|nr:hypothetical protein [Ruminiclostridium sp.]
MSKRCTSCGSNLTEMDRFCPNCGANSPQELNNSPVYSSAPQYNSYQSNQQYNSAPPPYTPSSAPQYNPYPNQYEEMTVGKWVLTLFVTSLGIIGLVMLFVWGFGEGPKARQNYCKAVLIMAGVVIALYILFFVVIFAILGIGMSEFISEIQNMSVFLYR